MSNNKFEKIVETQKQNSNWNLPNVAFMVGGFMIAAPVGIATAAWLALGKNVNIGSSLKQKYDQYSPSIKAKFNSATSSSNYSENDAYKTYKAEQVATYEAEIKRASDEANDEEKKFYDFVKSRQSAKDKAEFNDFIKSQEDKS